MNKTRKIFLIIMIAIYGLAFAYSSFAEDISLHEVYNRVLVLEGIEKDKYPMPSVTIIDSDGLKKQFIIRAKKEFVKDKKKYSLKEVDKLLKSYLKDREIFGLYDDKTDEIFINNNIVGCERDAYLAKYFIFYLINKEEGYVENPGSEDGRVEIVIRKIMASIFQKLYYSQYCEKPEGIQI